MSRSIRQFDRLLRASVADMHQSGAIPMSHFAGHILATIRTAIRGTRSEEIRIDNAQQNGLHGIQQARVRLAGDPNTYRLILAPADAPISVNGHPIGDHFALPLGDA